MGRLTRDPDIRYTQGENSMAVARYSLAVDRRRTGADGNRETDFINCVAFGRQAEFAERYLHQGTKIAITGRIQTGSYTNRDGQKVYTTDIVVEEQEFAESKAASDNRQGGGYNNYGGNGGQGSNGGYANRGQGQNYGGGQGGQSYGGGQSQGQNFGGQGGQYREESAEDFSSSVGEGFMNIPEGVEDEGLPFN